jgi:adenosylmethionine-8-amino-7-oxononanoate aminotransferase
MIVGRAAFLQRAREACDRHGTLLIADEVLTGFGRTGRLFACEHAGLRPDLLCLSKALTGGFLPLAATLATEEVYAAFLSQDRSRALLHGHSYTANPLACAVALESLAVLEEERGLERVRAIEAIHRLRLPAVARIPGVGETRCIGLAAAVELDRPAAAMGGSGYFDAIGPRLHREFLARGILLRPLGNVVYMLPPLCITDAEVHGVYDAMEEVIGGVVSY